MILEGHALIALTKLERPQREASKKARPVNSLPKAFLSKKQSYIAMRGANMGNKFKRLVADPAALAGAALVLAIFVIAGGAALWIKSNFG